MTVTEGWLGIVKNADEQFSDPDVVGAEQYLEYVNGAPYVHIHGAVTFDMEDTGQMCVRAKNMQGDYWEDMGGNLTHLRNQKKTVAKIVLKQSTISYDKKQSFDMYNFQI